MSFCGLKVRRPELWSQCNHDCGANSPRFQKSHLKIKITKLTVLAAYIKKPMDKIFKKIAYLHNNTSLVLIIGWIHK